MKSAKRQRDKGASDTEEPERANAKKSKTQVSFCFAGFFRSYNEMAWSNGTHPSLFLRSIRN